MVLRGLKISRRYHLKPLPVTAHRSGENMKYGKSELQCVMNRTNFPLRCKDLTTTVFPDTIKIEV